MSPALAALLALDDADLIALIPEMSAEHLGCVARAARYKCPIRDAVAVAAESEQGRREGERLAARLASPL